MAPSNGSPLPPKRLICKSPGSNSGTDYSGLSSRSRVRIPMPTQELSAQPFVYHIAEKFPLRTIMQAAHYVSYVYVRAINCNKLV